MSRIALAVDLGGTQLRVAAVDDAAQILAQADLPTDARGGPQAVIGQMTGLVDQIRAALPGAAFAGIAIGAPGPLDPLRGICLDPPTLAGWKHVPLAQLLQDATGLSAILENDANAAALGEWRHGAGRGTSSMVFVTVSTGIGGGVIADGRLLHGRSGLAGEIGHMTISEDPSALCPCGNRGCWEALAAGPAFAVKARQRAASGTAPGLASLAASSHDGLTPALVATAARNQDPDALALFSDEARYLAIGFANLLHLYAPEAIIVGGGLGQCLDIMAIDIRRELDLRSMPAYRDTPVRAAQLGTNAGLIGASTILFDGR